MSSSLLFYGHNRIAKIMPRVMKNKCQDVSAHSRAVVTQLDMMVHSLHGPNHHEALLEIFAKAGEKHANLGVQQKHYFLLGEAMLSTLEFFLASSSGYWKRVQRSWNALFQAMFEVMKNSSKRQEKRQDMMAKANKRSERLLKVSKPPKNNSLITVDTMMSEDSYTESCSSPESPRNLGANELMHLRMDKKSSRSMRNLMANQQQQHHHDEYDMPLRGESSHDPPRPPRTMTKTRPASLRNLLAGGGCKFITSIH